MKILITGAKGFVGKNLCSALKNIKERYDRTHGDLVIDEIYEYDIDSTTEQLEKYCKEADFVFNLAGVNRPKDPEEFMKGNFGFGSDLLKTLKKYGNKCPVMLSSSIQATLVGRYADGDYGKSKKAGEELFFDYAEETGAPVLVYRFPNLFGKWCRPNYNSAVATFCNNVANDLPIRVDNPAIELELLYIDDLVAELIGSLGMVSDATSHHSHDVTSQEPRSGESHHTSSEAASQETYPHRCKFDGVDTVFCKDGRYCGVPVTHHVTLGEIVDLLHKFADYPETLVMPEIANNSFAKKLYSTYLSYLPKEKVAFPLKMNVDARGSFTELLKTEKCGQISVNVSKPGITKGEHWHHTKWEFFIVVSGHALIQERRIGSNEIIEFEVSGEEIKAVHMLPGYTHNIINLSETQDLVTVMWANEQFDPNHPDTFHATVTP